jgi:hypothetical protein
MKKFCVLNNLIQLILCVFHTTQKKIREHVRCFFSYQRKKSAKSVFIPYVNQAIGGALSEK